MFLIAAVDEDSAEERDKEDSTVVYVPHRDLASEPIAVAMQGM
jgi:hypothetical protein